MPGIKAKIHRLSDEDREERNRKIEKMVALGCSYEDIGRRYGINRHTISNLIKRGQVRGGIVARFGNVHSLTRGCYGDGIQG